MIDNWTIPVRPLTGRAPRDVWVYVPDRAAEDPEARFPVLYMFDGHNLFFDETATYGKSWGMGDYLDVTGTELIVVGIDCDHRPPHARLSEYSPFTFYAPPYGLIRGKGHKFMRWLVETLKPEIDRRYPTIPDREATWIAGSSMGGLMSLYAVSAFNGVFSRAAALSPSVYLTDGRIIPLIKRTDFAPGTVVYMDYGEKELGTGTGKLNSLKRTAAALLDRGALLTFRMVPGGEHCEASWERQIPFFLPALFYEPPEDPPTDDDSSDEE